MSKLKLILIVAGVVIFMSMGVTIQVLSRKYQAEKSDRERLWQNNLALTSGNRHQVNLLYQRDEFISQLSDSLKSALNSLKIKPTEITKIIYRTITDKTIDTVLVEVNPISEMSWSVSDSGKCWAWKGDLEMIEGNPELSRTFFEYNNQTVDYFYQSRPKKFLFIHYGKKKVRQVTVPRCGETYEKTIEIVKE
jgi:hypothetical protein